jgi:hypothetical protein
MESLAIGSGSTVRLSVRFGSRVRLCAFILACLVVPDGALSADAVGFGPAAARDFADPTGTSSFSNGMLGEVGSPGFLVFFHSSLWGMVFNFEMDFHSEAVESREWMTFSFTALYERYLFYSRFGGPFLQLGAGMYMANSLVETVEEMRLSFLPVVGAGMLAVSGPIYLRVMLQYRGLQLNLPGSSVDRFPMGTFRAVFSAGILFQ